MKNSWLLAATARVVLSNPLRENVGAMAADPPPSGIGTGVTIAIAPLGGMAKGCYRNWDGAGFGIAAVPINIQRNSDGADSTQDADQAFPKFTLEPSASGSPNEMAGFDMPTVTGKPAIRLINGDARVAAAVADPDPDVTITSYSTRTRTKTVTLKSVGPASPAAVASPTAVDTFGMKTIKAAQLYQINDGQVQAAPSLSPIPLKPAATPTAGSGSFPTAGSSSFPPGSSGSSPQGGSGSSPAPFAPLPKGAPRISQIGDGQIQAPTNAAAPAAASGFADASPKWGSKGGKGSMAETSGSSEPLAAPVDALFASADDSLAASGNVPTDALFASTDALGLFKDEVLGGTEEQPLVKRQSRSGRTGGYGCKNKDGSTLEMTLKNGVLLDNKGRTGYIADNRQFQFDAPPQAGAQVTAGWGICEDGFLSLGPNKVFYQCLSGSFYNLYDRNIAAQCRPINLIALENRNC